MFSFDTSSSNCALYQAACTQTATLATSTLYAKSWFWEEPTLTADKCTHLKYYRDEGLMVSTCKTDDGDATACGANDSVVGGSCWIIVHALSTCGGANGGTETTITPGSFSLANCKAACEADPLCNMMMVDGSACKSYTGTCDFASEGSSNVYHRTACCYYTTPTTVKTGFKCGNENDLNGGADLHKTSTAGQTVQTCN
jgi:hypothetical protein